MSIDTGLTLVYNPNFPTPNVDQPSQQFRDNFGIIKTAVENLQTAVNDNASVIAFSVSQGSGGAITYHLVYPNNALQLPGSPTGSPTAGILAYISNSVQYYDGSGWRTLISQNNVGSVVFSNLEVTTHLQLDYSPSLSSDAVPLGYMISQLAIVSNTAVAQAVIAANAAVSYTQSDLNAEKINRANADTNLQSQITSLALTANANAVAASISNLSNSLASESNTRSSADTVLTTNLNNLTSVVSNTNTLLSNTISQVIVANNTITTLNATFGPAIANNTANIALLQSNIAILTTNGSTETSARIAGDAALSTRINAVVAAANANAISNLYIVATLPVSNVALGARAIVADANSPVFMGNAVGNGSVYAPVWYNGSVWVFA
jgi:hypothetical protein